MKKLTLKKVPAVEVPQWLLKLRKEPPEETALSVPKVIRQYTRRKKDIQVELESKCVTPATPATYSDQSCREIKIEEIDTATEILSSDIKMEPTSPCMVNIKEEKVSEITNIDIDQNSSYSKVYNHIKIKEENADDNCGYINDNIVKIKEEIVYEEIELKSGHNTNEKVVSHHLQHTNICNNNLAKQDSETDAMSLQNEKLIMNNTNTTSLPGGVQVKTEIDIEIMDDIEFVNTETVKKESHMETKMVKSMSNQLKHIEGNRGLRTITLKKCCLVARNDKNGLPIVTSKTYQGRLKAIANPPKIQVPENTVNTYKVFSCDMCSRNFNNKLSIEHHLIQLHSNAAHTCSTCYKGFLHYFQLLAHIHTHNGKPFVCDLCSKRFTKSKSYSSHMNTHLRERLHSCPVCLRRFARLDELYRHVGRHSRADTFDCKSCVLKFSRAAELRRHRETIHGERCLYPCYVCSRALHSETELKNHLRKHTEVHECVYCSKRFTDAVKWEEHCAEHIAKIHTDKATYIREPHVCHLCQKSFMYKSTLLTHVALHEGARPYSCGRCSRTYKTRSALTEHEKSHARPYACDICGARFGKKNSLVRHTRTHTGERPEICTHCKASFTQRSSMLTHIRQQHMPTLKFVSKRKTKRERKTKT